MFGKLDGRQRQPLLPPQLADGVRGAVRLPPLPQQGEAGDVEPLRVRR